MTQQTPTPATVADEAIATAQRDAMLRDQHALVRERRPVFVLDETLAVARKGSAERMARKRQRDAERAAAAGVVRLAAELPAPLAAEIESAGGLAQWIAARPPATLPAAEPVIERVEVPGPERIVETRVEVPAKLGAADQRRLQIGQAVERLSGWRARLVRWLLPR